MMFASTDWKFHLIWKKYEVCSPRDGSKLFVQNQLPHRFTLSILDVMEENIGQIERGFSGLGGFLSGGNKMRIRGGEMSEPGSLVGLDCSDPAHRPGARRGTRKSHAQEQTSARRPCGGVSSETGCSADDS